MLPPGAVEALDGVEDRAAQFLSNRRRPAAHEIARIWQRPREAIELRDDERVAAAARRERLPQTRTLAMGPGQAVIDVRALGADAEPCQCISLRREVLIVGRDTGIPTSSADVSSSFGRTRCSAAA
jgi:hypothetical protein